MHATIAPAVRRTPEEIAELIRQWEEGPHWQLSETEGFEAHRPELAAHEEAAHRAWSDAAERRILARTAELGCPGNLQLAIYVDTLETRIDLLEAAIERLQGGR